MPSLIAFPCSLWFMHSVFIIAGGQNFFENIYHIEIRYKISLKEPSAVV